MERSFRELRLSVTNICNFRCSFCVGSDRQDSSGETEFKQDDFPQQRGLDFASYLEIIHLLHQILDLESIHLTGGEPTLYRSLPRLVSGLKHLGIPKIKMTTNASGIRFGGLLEVLKKEGLDSMNISLPSIQEANYHRLTDHPFQARVFRNIEKAIKIGLDLKLNATILRNKNDDQVLPLLEYGKGLGIRIRFLELMKMGESIWKSFPKFFVSEAEILKTISQKYWFSPLPREQSATARYFQTNCGYIFGIIANESSPFCSDCNRLRLDSSGYLYGCIGAKKGFSVLGKNKIQLKNILENALKQKNDLQFQGGAMYMRQIGG